MTSSATARLVERAVVDNHFAVLATTGVDGRPDSAGVSYSAVRERDALVMYVMTRRHLRKARDIVERPEVSVVIPIPRRLLWFVPPATVQLTGSAVLLGPDDPLGRAAFARFRVGRRIVSAYDAMARHGERRVCFLRIAVDPIARAYMVGAGLLAVMRRMEAGTLKVAIT